MWRVAREVRLNRPATGPSTGSARRRLPALDGLRGDRDRRRRRLPPGSRLVARRLPGRRRLLRGLRVPDHRPPARSPDPGAGSAWPALRAFWARRARRLLPALVMLAVALSLVGQPHRPGRRPAPAGRHTGRAGVRGQLAPAVRTTTATSSPSADRPCCSTCGPWAWRSSSTWSGPSWCSSPYSMSAAAHAGAAMGGGHGIRVLGGTDGGLVRAGPRPLVRLLRHLHPCSGLMIGAGLAAAAYNRRLAPAHYGARPRALIGLGALAGLGGAAGRARGGRHVHLPGGHTSGLGPDRPRRRRSRPGPAR